jgi:hypothetical protein
MRGTVSANLHLQTYSFTLRTKFGYPPFRMYFAIRKSFFVDRAKDTYAKRFLLIPAQMICNLLEFLLVHKNEAFEFYPSIQIPITKKPFSLKDYPSAERHIV